MEKHIPTVKKALHVAAGLEYHNAEIFLFGF